MPDNISFNEIPVDIRTPGHYVEIDNSRAASGLPGMARKILVVANKLAAGTLAAATPARILRDAQAEEYFGRGSVGHLMLRALKKANATTDVWAVALADNAAGAAAAGSAKVGGAPTAAGTLKLYIGGQAVQVAVAVAEAAATTAAKLAAAINAATDLPVTAAVDGVDTTKVVITARNKGEHGNGIDLRATYYQGEALPKGLTLAIVTMAGGAGNPSIADAIAAIGDDQYYTIVTPWTDAANMTALERELDTRWGPMQQKTGHAFAGLSGSHATLTTWGAARNSPHTSAIGVYDSPTPPWVWAAVWAGIVEYYGAIDPARPFQTLKLPGLLAPPEESRFTRAERDLLLRDGISTFTAGPDGSVSIERVITTYQTNATGVEDVSYLDLNTVWTVDYIRYAVRARIALKFGRHKLADDGTRFGAGQPIVTPSIIRGELLALFGELEDAGLVEKFDQFKRDLLVLRSTADQNRVNAIIPPDLINQFRVFAASVQFL